MAKTRVRNSAFNRYWHGPSRQQSVPKRSAHNLCENCNHFRSDHRSSLACTVESCNCEVMVFG